MTSKEVVSLALFLCHQPKADDEGRASIQVTNQLLESMGVTPEQKH